MATKIKGTPVLTGSDAIMFNRLSKENESNRVSKAEYERAHELYKRIVKIIN